MLARVPQGACLSQHPTDTMLSLTPIHIAASFQTSPKQLDNAVPPQQNIHHFKCQGKEKQLQLDQQFYSSFEINRAEQVSHF